MKKLITLLVCALPMLTQAQTISKNADSLLTAYTKNNLFSGNVLIASHGRIVFEKAYGYADKDYYKPNTIRTEFRAGSLTKMFTSALILQMAETNKMALTDSVSKYIPGFVNGNHITIKNLLSHTSGISGNVIAGNGSLEEIVKNFKNEAAYAPGTRFEYNNFNYMLLAYIAEKVGGAPYAELVKKNVFEKAGMLHTGIDYPGRKSSSQALGYAINPQNKQQERMETANVSAASGAGAMYTTVEDLLKWSLAIDQHKIFSAETFAMATTPVKPGYGLGWMISNPDDKHPAEGHTGSIEGFMADFMKFRQDGVTIVFLSNLLPSIDVHVSKALTAIAFGDPFEMEGPKKEITLTADQLSKYVGTYTSEEGNMVVSLKDNKLIVLAPGGDTAELAAQAPDKFYIRGPEIGVDFMTEAGKVTTLKVNMHGGITFKKLK